MSSIFYSGECYNGTLGEDNNLSLSVLLPLQNYGIVALAANLSAWPDYSTVQLRDVVQPPVFVTAALKRKLKKLALT